MKKRTSIIILAVMFFALVPISYASGKNLMENPGFESTISGWKSSNSSIEQSDEQAHTGKYSAKVSVVSMYGASRYYYNFKKGVEYTVSVWIRMAKGLGEHSARFIFVYEEGLPQWQELASGTVVNDEGWTLMSTSVIYNGTNKTGACEFNVRIDDGTKPVEFYMDDVTITSSVETIYRETEYKDGEMVENRGFDDDTEGWIENGASVTRIEGEGYNNSAASALIEAKANGYVGSRLYFEKGKKYNLSAFIKTGGNGAFFNLIVKHDDGSCDTVTFLNPTDGDWHIIEGEYLQKRDSENVVVYVTSNNTSRYYLDEMSCIPKSGTYEIPSHIGELSGYNVFVNSQKTDIPIIIDGESMLCSLSELAPKIGGIYSGNDNYAVIIRGINKLTVYSDNMLFEKNGKLNKMDKKATVINGVFFADVNYIAKQLGCTVKIIGGSVYIETKDRVQLNYSAKMLRDNKKLNICLLNGSEPQRSGTFDPYTVPVKTLIYNWFNRNYSDCTINVIEEDHTATGAILGAFRAAEVVKENDVDLLFIDLYRNDILQSAETEKRYLESLIRSVRTINPNIDIVFLQSLNEKLVSMLESNVEPSIDDAYNTISGIYNIPIISNGKILYKLYTSEGKSYDSYHNKTKNPNTSGSEVYAQVIIDLIKEGLNNADESSTTMNRSITNTFFGKIISTEAFVLSDGWSYEKDRLSGSDKIGYVLSSRPGSEITAEVEGNVIGLYYQSAPDSGDILYSVDGGEYKKLSTFDEYAYKFEHMKGSILADNLSSGIHLLKIKVSADKNENSIDTYIRIGGILVGENN